MHHFIQRFEDGDYDCEDLTTLSDGKGSNDDKVDNEEKGVREEKVGDKDEEDEDNEEGEDIDSNINLLQEKW